MAETIVSLPQRSKYDIMHLVVMRMKLVKMTLCLCLFLMTLCGCRATHDQVLVTCYPLQYLVEQIAQDRVSCVLLSENTLIQRAQIRDDYQELLAQSDALLYLGGLESYYEAYADEITDSRIEQVNLVDQLGNFPFLRYGENNETQPWYAGDAFDDVDMYYSDPTLWMDAVTMCGMAACIRDYLSERYPAYAQEFADNYDALEIALSKLDARYQQLREKQIRVAVMTPNFGHWQNYGIQVYPVCLSRYGALPDDEQLSVIIETLREDGVQYMAIEENLPQDMIDLRLQIINELGLTPVPLNNISSLSDAQQRAGKNYLTLMQENLNVLLGLE